MKYLKTLSLLLIITTILSSCKKSNDAASQPDLKNTIWSGEFHYTTGENKSLQPFTLKLNADSSTEWIDISSARPGGTWSLAGNQVTLTFPDKTKATGTVAPDKWTDVSMPASSGFQIDNLAKTTTIDPSVITNTSWSGDLNGSILKIKFVDASNATITIGTASAIPAIWYISGAGVHIGYSYGLGNLSSNIYYAIFQTGNTTLKGFEMRTIVSIGGISHNYNTWNAKKQ